MEIQQHQLISITKYKNGEAKIAISSQKTNKRMKMEKYTKEQNEKNNLRMRQYRRKRIVYDLLRMIVPDRMLTLTIRENITDIKLAKRIFQQYLKEMVRGEQLSQYLGVLEQQKRGSYHLHIAHNGYIKVQPARKIWRQVLSRFDLEGNIDVTAWRGGRKTVTRKMTGYLAKYLTKGDDGYIRSRNIAKPDYQLHTIYWARYYTDQIIQDGRHDYAKELDHGVMVLYCSHLVADEYIKKSAGQIIETIKETTS